MRLSDLDTPALVVDLDVMERNLRRAAEYARRHDLRMRPHTKTHKSPALGRLQLDLGAAGLSVAKVGEAEVMLKANPPELLVAYPVIGRHKLERLMEVARRTRVTVALDSLPAARQLSDAARAAHIEVGVLAEVDVGMGRMGVRPGEELLELARGILRLPWVRFEGVAFFPGQINDMSEAAQAALEDIRQIVQAILRDFRLAGIEVPIISGGNVHSLYHSHRITGMNEIRPGTYIFNDKTTLVAGTCTLEDCAASILTTVVSTAKPGQVIIDGGSKTFSSDRLVVVSEVSFGYVLEAPGAVITRLNEEHGYVDVRRAGRDFSVGDRVRVIPNHVCVAMNLHETVYGVRGEEVVSSWTVEGRGKLQ